MIEGRCDVSVSIRLYGIDAPEIGQDYGVESRSALAQMAPKGAEVAVVPMGFDKYDRMLGIVVRGDMVLNHEQIVSGAAWVEPNHCRAKMCRRWMREAKRAAKNDQGLWKHKAIPPWIWRKKYKAGHNLPATDGLYIWK